MDLFSFDSAYVERLAAGDSAVVEHFNGYFGELIFIKLRARQYSSHTIDDIKQETFLRVFQVLRRDGLRHPERMGAFVNTVCNHVAMEFGRAGSRITFLDETPDSPIRLPIPSGSSSMRNVARTSAACSPRCRPRTRNC